MDWAPLLGGLGLFFLGIRALSAELQAATGPRMRAAVRAGTATPWHAAAVGLVLGAATQSSNAVAFIAASLRGAGLIPPRRALPLVAWSNAGTAALVLLATFDLRTAALWLLGVVGCWRYFAPAARWRGALGALAGLGLLLLGLALLKQGAAPLRDSAAVRELLVFAGEAWLPAFLVGFAVTLMAQSSSAVSILAITLHGAGLLAFGQAAMAVCGASLGSGAAVWLMAGGMTGTARQPVVFQAALKAAGAFVVAALLVAEDASGQPGLLALTALAADEAGTRLALLFLALQLLPALLAAPLHVPLQALLDRWVRASPAEEWGRPRHVFPAAAEDPPSALPLVAADQARLLRRLPPLLNPLRGEGAPPAGAVGASPALEAELMRFLDGLLARPLAAETLDGVLHARERLALLADLREAVSAFAGAAAPLGEASRPMAEALHLLLEELRDAADAEARGWILRLAEDRGEMMRRIRRAAAPDGREALLAATALFERAVWLVRRLALLPD